MTFVQNYFSHLEITFEEIWTFYIFFFLINCAVGVSIVVFEQSTPVLVTNIQLVDNLHNFSQQNSNYLFSVEA